MRTLLRNLAFIAIFALLMPVGASAAAVTAINQQSVVAANGAAAENTTDWLKTMSAVSGLDTAASAGSQQVPVKVESTANPNLRAAMYNGGNEAAVSATGGQLLGGASKTTISNCNATVASGGKQSAGQLYAIFVNNNAGAGIFVQVFDALTAGVTLGTTVPMLQFNPSSASGNSLNGGTVSMLLPAIGVPMANGVSVACTTAFNGAVGAANGATVTVVYA